MEISPTTWVTDVKERRRIIGESLGIPEQTLPQAVVEAVESNPDRIQYVTADGQEVLLKDFYKLCRAVGKSCISLGLKPFQGVGILGFNSVEWFAADIGVSFACGLPAGIYTTNLPDVVAYILNHCNSEMILVDTEEQLKKVLSVKDQCTALKTIVIWGAVDKSKYAEHGDLVRTWDEFIKLSEDVSDALLEERMALPTPENVCKLIYTSGTTGPPKAVMISHDNSVYTAKKVGLTIEFNEKDFIVSFLPCSHIAANTMDVVGALINGYRVNFASPDALKGSLVQTLRKVRPTVFLAVPRVYEKIQEKLLQIGATSGPIKRAISTWAKGIGTQLNEALDKNDDSLVPWGHKLADFLVFQNVKKALGLDRCKIIINAAAPLQPATDEYFRSLNLRIIDLYGMSEATGPITGNFPNYRRGTSGKCVMGIKVKLHNADETGEGEPCFRGRNMFMGYLHDPEASSSTIDEEGYIHSGDLGRIDEEGFITITGRAKELIVTAGGENVAPALVESTLISAMPAISRAFAIGDKRKFISCLLVPYMDEDGQLIGPASRVCDGVTTGEQATGDETWVKYVENGVAQANKGAISNAARVRKFVLLTKDFSVDGGELTPTMKVKRRIVTKKYEEIIDNMYK